MDECDIQILMAVYNAEQFVGEQIESLRAQTFRKWRLLVRDNASSDRTSEILRRYELLEPDRIKVIYGDVNLGAKGNFAKLLNEADASYVMFCDADDVWLPKKIEKTMSLMHVTERKAEKNHPVLVHTDLKVVDAELKELGESFWAYQKSDPYKGGVLNRLLIQNCVTGCTVMINRPLLDLVRPLPDTAIMHDWWIALVASAFGRIGVLSDRTMLYRQHGGNDTGAKRRNLVHYARMAAKTFDNSGTNHLRNTVNRARIQAETFLKRFGSILNESERRLVIDFVSLFEHGAIKRRVILLRHRILKCNPLSNLGLLLRI